ncbi:histone-lysine N-methyltransferase, H3 lysine-79 specific-like [Mytilus trossulus]|uniref:histone-lysine N-methyltransferase, H3 lysine-79 specific-like n=1 Tax=Mytilus trossulus TaxID=6551 RepID=UPI0030077A27
MEEWLDSNLNSLMVDHTDQFIIRESHTEASQAEATPKKQKKRESVNVTTESEKKKKEEASQPTPKKQKKKDIVNETTELEKKKKDLEKEERDANALAKRNAQKVMAEEILLKRLKSTESNNNRDQEMQKTKEKECQDKDKEYHKECVSAKQFSELNEEVRRLRKKLDWHINSETCGTSLKKESSSVHVAQKKPKMETISTLSVLNNTPDMCCQSEDSSLYNSYSRSQLEDFISHIDSLYTAVKTLLLQLFPESYILSHSVSGKAANTKTVAKPQFDSRLYGVFVKILKEKFGSTTKEITEKVHSVQKYLQKKTVL